MHTTNIANLMKERFTSHVRSVWRQLNIFMQLEAKFLWAIRYVSCKNQKSYAGPNSNDSDYGDWLVLYT